ncbi:MAG: hypothetical protein ACRD3J_08290, partial [Thermoanaerobaculia bacterium]
IHIDPVRKFAKYLTSKRNRRPSWRASRESAILERPDFGRDVRKIGHLKKATRLVRIFVRNRPLRWKQISQLKADLAARISSRMNPRNIRRWAEPGSIQHVYGHTVDGLVLFHDDTDRARFLTYLEESVATFDTKLLGFSLMDNHYHLILQL